MLKRLVVLICVFSAIVVAGRVGLSSEKPKIAPVCKQCHVPDDRLLRGNFVSLSQKAETIQIQIGPATWIVKYDDETKLKGIDKINKIPKDKEISIEIEDRAGHLYARTLAVKPPVKVPEEKLIKVDELSRLIEKGAEKGGFILVDSRPAPRYHEGHIPGAISIYDAEFDKNINKLPEDKNTLLIFYCAGVTCRLSPNSAGRAEKLGYKNVKIFQDGMPEWKKAGKPVLSTINFVKDNIERDIPQILIDLRKPEDAMKGHIQGAVSIPSDDIAAMIDRFPADKKAPIILYSYDDKTAISAFKVVRDKGYLNVSILEGGVKAWEKAGFPIQKGQISKEIVYVPKPRPGEIAVEEFKKIAETLPNDKFILDVRDEDEAMQGMLKGAKNIPTQDISKRLAEIPKDKEIVTHCSTGVRAEMAYHILKEAGYKTRFLNANIKIDSSGRYEISKD